MTVMQPRPTAVVAGIFHRKNPKTGEPEVLLFQRAFGDLAGGMWEFPGGKVEAGESEEAALIRELEEEITIRVQVGKPIGSAQFQGNTLVYELTAFFVEGPVEKIMLAEHEAMKWVTHQAVVQSELALGDRPLMDPCFNELRKIYGKK